MGKVINVNFGHNGADPYETGKNDGFLCGFAAAIGDACRSADAETVLIESGISLEEFKAAGVEEYDLDILREILK
jgi:hypothetical protein